jgi:replicative DNA helicase
LAECAANQGRPVVYVACEEPPATLYAKTLARLGRISYAVAQFGWSGERDAIDRARSSVRLRQSSQRLLYVEGFSDLATLQEIVRAHFQRYEETGGTGVLVIDYLQCIAQMVTRAGSQTRDENLMNDNINSRCRILEVPKRQGESKQCVPAQLPTLEYLIV